MHKFPIKLRAAASTAIKADRALSLVGSAKLEALASGADPKALRKFHMNAYNGGAMRFFWSDIPVVVDLAGMSITDKSRPVLLQHDPERIVGHSTRITVVAGTLQLDGVASGGNQVTADVLAAADNGFPWQASIGADMQSWEEVPAGNAVTVNGQTFTGPILVVRTSSLGEISFVALGADDSTDVRLVAGKNQPNTPPRNPDVKHNITLIALMALAAAYPHCVEGLKARANIVDADSDDAKKGHDTLKAWAETQDKPAVKAESTAPAGVPADLQAHRKALADESRRVHAIQAACGTKHGDIAAKAIELGWDEENTKREIELVGLRAGRAQAPAIHVGRDEGLTGEVLEASVCMAGDLPNVEKAYSEKVLEAAQKKFRGKMNLGKLLLSAAYANGYAGRDSLKEDPDAVLRAAFAGKLQAGVSTIDIGPILSNIANKFLLAGFMAVEDTWRLIAAKRNVNDFKTVTSYRMTGANQYKKVGPAGLLEHGTLGNESFTNKAETYGLMLAITRQDQYNDDLGALTTVPKILGRGGALKLNEVFWLEFLDNSTFFTSGHNNLSSGSPGSLLTIDGLTNARTKFRKQKDANGKPLAITPAIVLVPPELEIAGDVILNSVEMRDTTASTKAGTTNAHRGKYQMAVSDYLSNDAMTGYSTTGWYMLANPDDLPVMEVAFLNGQEAPTVQNADADFNTLGIQMRGFHDFGCAKQDYRAGVRSNGA